MLIYRNITDDETFAFIVGWAETNNVPYELRTARNLLQLGLSPYHWRKAEYVGVA